MVEQHTWHDLVVPPEHLVLEGQVTVDPGAVLGYRPERPVQDPRLVLGAGARLRSGTVVYAGSRIGRDLQTGHNVVIREENRIGDGFRIWSNSIVDYGCVIGSNVKVHSGVYVAQFTTIEDDVFLAPGVQIANDIHPGCPSSGPCMRGPTIKRGCQVGVNATILPFITIGEGCLIGAGSVVTRDIPPHSVVLGNPGRVVREVFELRCVTGLTDQPYYRATWPHPPRKEAA